MTTIVDRLKISSMMFAVIGALSVTADDALAESTLFALSTDRAYAFSEQEVSVEITQNTLALGIDWKRTSPLVFAKEQIDLYAVFFEKLVLGWEANLENLRITDRNTKLLAYLPTKDGEISVHFFARLADGSEFTDGTARIRMIYCGEKGSNCIAGQVLFFTRGQISQLEDILSNL